jgi:ribosomal RNA-processing protein 12
MKKLVRLFGFDYLLPLVAESASQLINYVKKLGKPENKAKKTTNDRVREKTVDEMMASDEEDSGDELKWPDIARGRGLNENRRKRGYHEEGGSARDSSQVLIRNNDFAGLEVKDLARTVDHESDSDDDGGITFDDRGRLVVTTRSNDARQSPEDYIVSLTNSSMARNMEKRVHVGQEQRGKKLGAAYKSKKAGGDVTRKGQKFDPYAYVPLDGKSYTKKNRHRAVDQLDSVVRGRKRHKR